MRGVWIPGRVVSITMLEVCRRLEAVSVSMFQNVGFPSERTVNHWTVGR